jgi:hypothetical protein
VSFAGKLVPPGRAAQYWCGYVKPHAEMIRLITDKIVPLRRAHFLLYESAYSQQACSNASIRLRRNRAADNAVTRGYFCG